MPAYRAFAGKLGQELRYGENPHQTAAFYQNRRRTTRHCQRQSIAGQGVVLQQSQ